VSVHVDLREVLPRDGLQDLSYHVPTDVKVKLVARLRKAGLRWIEVTSLVSPRWIPQFADAEAVIAEAKKFDGLRIAAFVPNQHGLERALDAGVDEVSLAIAATDRLSQANFAMSRDEALVKMKSVVAAAVANGVEASVTIGGAFGCPFEGVVLPDRVLELAQHFVDFGVGSVVVADTIGVATPVQVGDLVGRVRAIADTARVGIHLHVDHGPGGVVEGVRAGATVIDVSTSGIGGCPFVPDPPGNVSTTAAAMALDQEGVGYDQRLADLESAELDVQRMLEEVREDAAIRSA
jgi:hydroxymethylglutaryl-CoA lyase